MLTVRLCCCRQDVVKAAMEQVGRSEHAFDIDAEPEPVPVECGAGDAGIATAADDDDIDDGFGLDADENDYNDNDKGLQLIESDLCDITVSNICQTQSLFLFSALPGCCESSCCDDISSKLQLFVSLQSNLHAWSILLSTF